MKELALGVRRRGHGTSRVEALGVEVTNEGLRGSVQSFASWNLLLKRIDFGVGVGYSTNTFRGLPRNDLLGVIIMEWTAPAFEEVCLNCEINSYASAKL